MTPLEKFREVVAATRASGGEFVVRTLDEAAALLECVDQTIAHAAAIRADAVGNVRASLGMPPATTPVAGVIEDAARFSWYAEHRRSTMPSGERVGQWIDDNALRCGSFRAAVDRARCDPAAGEPTNGR